MRLDMHWMPWALSLARVKAGKSRAARMAMMAMTTSSSINVKPEAADRLSGALTLRENKAV